MLAVGEDDAMTRMAAAWTWKEPSPSWRAHDKDSRPTDELIDPAKIDRRSDSARRAGLPPGTRPSRPFTA